MILNLFLLIFIPAIIGFKLYLIFGKRKAGLYTDTTDQSILYYNTDSSINSTDSYQSAYGVDFGGGDGGGGGASGSYGDDSGSDSGSGDSGGDSGGGDSGGGSD